MTWIQNDNYEFLDELDELKEMEEMLVFREKGKTPYSICKCGYIGFSKERFCKCCGSEMGSYVSYNYIRHIAKDGSNNVDMILESKRK